MSALDLLTDLDLKTERATEPPKRWRNWFRVPCDWQWRCRVCGATGMYKRGDLIPDHCKVYPSKDLAETAARDDAPYYLGAFPDGEAP